MARRAQKYLDEALANAEARDALCLELGQQAHAAQVEAYERWCEWERAIDAECEAAEDEQEKEDK